MQDHFGTLLLQGVKARHLTPRDNPPMTHSGHDQGKVSLCCAWNFETHFMNR